MRRSLTKARNFDNNNNTLELQRSIPLTQSHISTCIAARLQSSGALASTRLRRISRPLLRQIEATRLQRASAEPSILRCTYAYSTPPELDISSVYTPVAHLHVPTPAAGVSRTLHTSMYLPASRAPELSTSFRFAACLPSCSVYLRRASMSPTSARLQPVSIPPRRYTYDTSIISTSTAYFMSLRLQRTFRALEANISARLQYAAIPPCLDDRRPAACASRAPKV